MIGNPVENIYAQMTFSKMPASFSGERAGLPTGDAEGNWISTCKGIKLGFTTVHKN